MLAYALAPPFDIVVGFDSRSVPRAHAASGTWYARLHRWHMVCTVTQVAHGMRGYTGGVSMLHGGSTGRSTA